jgi:hypothetical protein
MVQVVTRHCLGKLPSLLLALRHWSGNMSLMAMHHMLADRIRSPKAPTQGRSGEVFSANSSTSACCDSNAHVIL